MRTAYAASCLSAIALAACSPSGQPTTTGGGPDATARSSSVSPATEPASTIELVVFAAASLDEAFRAVGAAFEVAHPGTTVTFSFAGSQTLATQINEGADADVFASANATQMIALIGSGEVVSGTQRTFARNRLVVITPSDNPSNVTTLQDLAQPGLKLVLAQKSVPVGDYALQFLAKAAAMPDYTAAYSPTVLANVVSFEDDVNGVLTKVGMGEADGGIVYASDISRDGAAKVARIEIPDALNVIAAYPIAPLVRSGQPRLAQAFVDYVQSPDGQANLVAHGFLAAADG